MKHMIENPLFWLALTFGVAFAHYAPGLTLGILLIAGPAAIIIAIGEYFTWR